MTTQEIIVGDCREVLRTMDAGSVQCVVTSPPYWGLRDYGVDGQLGSEATLEEFIATMVHVFREVKRVLRDDGTLWLNLGSSYATATSSGPQGSTGQRADRTFTAAGLPGRCPPGFKPKDLINIPFYVAEALRADGWYLRSDIIWHKPNPMPESCTDRPTKAHEYVFLLTKQPRYFYDAEAVREKQGEPTRRQKTFRGGCYTENATHDNSFDYTGHEPYSDDVSSLSGRNKRTVWTMPKQPYSEAHFATFPEALVVPCLKAGTSAKGCCPECGKAWTRLVEKPSYGDWHGRKGTDDELAKGQVGKPIPDDYHRTTTGWEPGCECFNPDQVCPLGGNPDDYKFISEPVPCKVLDPFCGSGTVGVVARKLGLNFVGIELNPEYARLAERRIADCLDDGPKPEVDVPGQMTFLTDDSG
jgi:DNA modification methylase